jgi:hypothetical protein
MAGRIREPAAFGSGGYLKAAGIAVRRRGRPSESKPKPAISVEVSTDSGLPKAAAMSTDSALVVDDHGFTARYASMRRFVVMLRGTSSPEARAVITTAPGEEGQVDYREGPRSWRYATPPGRPAPAGSCP